MAMMNGEAMDGPEERDRTPITAYAATMLALCLFVGATEGYDVQAMALAAPLVKAGWGLGFNQIGALLSISAIGLVLGSFLLSPLGDSLGRRPAILLGLFIAAIGTGTGALAPDFRWLAVTRLVAGLGLGLALPNVLAMAMELMPRRVHTFAVVIVSCGYPLGSALGGAFASALVPAHGHAAVFFVGGAGTTIALLLCALFLPESPSFLAHRPGRAVELERVLARLGRRIPAESLHRKVEAIEGFRARIAAIFAPERRRLTSLLWMMNLGNVALVYFFFSWLPSLIVASGLTARDAILATSLFSASGAVGALALAFLLPRLGPVRVLAAAYLLAIAATSALAVGVGAGIAFYLALMVSGVVVVGSQFCLSAVVAQAYPGAIRATASGFATGIGRAGAIATPIAAGALIGLFQGSGRSFMIALIPAAIALVAAVLLEFWGDLRRARS
ncbi:MFS transporter [Sphingobium jiangsuense]|uniref:AAHS family 4-hydroxybenzoate transporter-like MFS transporter n=1 Tax=Sphingobium jiangsuense TaxID=870476 RepID=A0A7W6BF22_9SPHN|nr:MFS transporter [Sphingobium jiangsuense]MBB3925683.1 AAHS family 4-hydroxybenzoate transporter-like MFS transporter [Sphingobium jiangsuense]GLT00353.1 MFS transporter [Sphingobium jiangsuense]